MFENETFPVKTAITEAEADQGDQFQLNASYYKAVY
jgi:hypothetical protein